MNSQFFSPSTPPPHHCFVGVVWIDKIHKYNIFIPFNQVVTFKILEYFAQSLACR